MQDLHSDKIVSILHGRYFHQKMRLVNVNFLLCPRFNNTNTIPNTFSSKNLKLSYTKCNLVNARFEYILVATGNYQSGRIVILRGIDNLFTRIMRTSRN